MFFCFVSIFSPTSVSLHRLVLGPETGLSQRVHLNFRDVYGIVPGSCTYTYRQHSAYPTAISSIRIVFAFLSLLFKLFRFQLGMGRVWNEGCGTQNEWGGLFLSANERISVRSVFSFHCFGTISPAAVFSKGRVVYIEPKCL